MESYRMKPVYLFCFFVFSWFPGKLEGNGVNDTHTSPQTEIQKEQVTPFLSSSMFNIISTTPLSSDGQSTISLSTQTIESSKQDSHTRSQPFTLHPSFQPYTASLSQADNISTKLTKGLFGSRTPVLMSTSLQQFSTGMDSHSSSTIENSGTAQLNAYQTSEIFSESSKGDSSISGDGLFLLMSTTSAEYGQLESSSSYSMSSQMVSLHNDSYHSTQPVTIVPKRSRQSRYFLVIKSDDCPRLRVHNVNHQLSKALSTLGVLNVSADIAKAKCQTQLNVNITATAPYSAILLLEDSKRHNLSIRVFNRTFKIIDIKNLSGDDRRRRITIPPTIIGLSKQEFSAYVAVGCVICLIILVFIIYWCVKCRMNSQEKRMGALRSSHTPLTPEDYTLTPIPRPTSLYVDYYRNSISADVYSTTSAGSIGSTSPSVEKGIVHSFDTSIVPLEDTALSNNNLESPTGNVWRSPMPMVTSQGLVYCNAIADSRERLHPRHSNLGLVKAVGVSNPTYQRY